MFNLIMRTFDWALGREAMPLGRFFEYTDERIAAQFRENGRLQLDRLSAMPCLFMEEGTRDELAYVGQINRAREVGNDVVFEYTLDADVPPLQNSTIYANRMALDMPLDFEFSRNHWAVKEVDLYRFLLRMVRPRRQRPIVFQIPEHERIEPALASAMMPFDMRFNAVYDSIRLASENAGLRCRRADDI